MNGELWAMVYKVTVIVIIVAIVAQVVYQNWKRLRRPKESLRDAVFDRPKRVPKDWAVNLDKSDVWIVGAGAATGKIVLAGWAVNRKPWEWSDGDYLIIYTGGRDTRYRIDKLEYNGSSRLFTAECSFAPRGMGTRWG